MLFCCDFLIYFVVKLLLYFLKEGIIKNNILWGTMQFCIYLLTKGETMADEKKTQAVYQTMPNSVEAEKNLLCCIMRDADMQLELISALNPNDFYQSNHAEIFAAMQKISAQNLTVNFASVADHLRRNGKLVQIGDVDYLSILNDAVPSVARGQEYLQIVKRASTMRCMIQICGDVTKMAYTSDSAEKVIEFAEQKIFELSHKGTNSGLIDLSDHASKTFKLIMERFQNPQTFHGIETGYTRLDKLTNGMHGGELIVIAARPGVGKSALAMNIVENVAKQGRTVAVFSLEMSNDQLVERMLASMSGVSLASIKSGRLERGEQDVSRLLNATNVIGSTMHLFGNDNPNVKPAEVRSQCRRIKNQTGLDLVVIDYIGLMEGDRGAVEGRQNEVASITRALKIMAKELDVPVIALSQLKRDAEIRNIKTKGGEGGGSEPVLSDLRESGAIEQDADIVMFIHREDPEQRPEDVTLIVAKHRNGEQAKIPLKWIGHQVRFHNPDFMQTAAIAQAAPVEEQQDVPEDIVMTDDTEEDGQFLGLDENE